MKSLRTDIERYWRELACVTRGMPFETLAGVADVLLACQQRGGTVFIAGNGGSAATASHFACDLAKGTRVSDQPTFRVIPLTDNVPLMTAWGNDTSYERIFAEQLSALVQPRDVVVLISASGNSANVLRAAEVARRAGATVVSLTGKTGGRLAGLSNITVRVPAEPIEQVEDAHVVVTHSLCVALRERLKREQPADRPVVPWPAARDDTVIDLLADAGT